MTMHSATPTVSRPPTTLFLVSNLAAGGKELSQVWAFISSQILGSFAHGPEPLFAVVCRRHGQ